LASAWACRALKSAGSRRISTSPRRHPPTLGEGRLDDLAVHAGLEGDAFVGFAAPHHFQDHRHVAQACPGDGDRHGGLGFLRGFAAVPGRAAELVGRARRDARGEDQE
jgi:hypothetical protein